MSYDAGTAFLQIIPSFRGFGAAMRREAAAAGRDAGRVFGEEFNRVAAATSGRAPVGPDRTSSARSGSQSAGAFADAFRARLEAAQRSMPTIKIGTATGQADRDLIRIKAQLVALRDAKIGVDISAADAAAELDRLQARLAAMAANSPDIDVRVNAGRAAAELKLLQTQINRIDGQNPVITPVVNPAPAIAGIGLIGIAALTLLPILIPVTAAASAALAGIATGAFVAVAGIGVLVLALAKVVAAVQAGSAADEEAKRSSGALVSQRSAAAGAADQLRSAERSLANTKATAAAAERAAARSIADALRNLSDARAEAVLSAQQAAARVTDAERSLADAQARALDAQKALTRARLDAKDALEDLDSRVKNNALAQRDAALQLEKAEADLAFVRQFGSRANARQLEQVQLAYDQAKQRVDDLALTQERLAGEQAQAAQDGIEGSKQVTDAKAGVLQAEEQVARAEQAAADARAQQARDAKAAQRDIADAQRAVGDAQERAAEQARQAAFALANAQQAVVSAQRAVATSAASMGASGTSAADKYRDALAKLSPAGREFVAFIRDSLMPAFGDMRRAAEEGLLPGLQAGMRAAAPLFKPLLGFVGATSRAFGDLFESAGKALGGPFWTDFFNFMSRTMGPNTKIFGRILGGLLKTFAGLLVALDPIARRFGEAFARLTEKWAKFAESAASGKSEGFKRFLAYMRDVMPKVSAFFGSFGDALGRIIKGLAPFGEDLMAIFKVIFDFISKIPPVVIGAIAAAFATLAVGIGAVTLALKAFRIVAMLLAVGSGPIALIVLGVAALAAGLIYAYKHSETFRNIVDGAFRAVADAAVWLWKNGIKPAFDGIAAVFGFWWNNIAKPIFTAFKLYLENVLIPVVRFLWDNVVKPVFKGIGNTISFAWNNVIKPVFNALKDFISGKVAPAFSAGVDAIKAAWDGLREVAKKPVEFVVNTVIGGLVSVIDKVAGLFPGVPSIGDKLGLPRKFADGGVMPGYSPGVDTSLIAVGGGEAIMRPEWTRAVGPSYVEAMNAAARTGGIAAVRRLGVPGFARGGIFGDISDVVKGTAKGAVSLGKGAIDFLKSPVSFLKAGFAGPLGKLGSILDSPFTNLVKAVPRLIVDKVVAAAKGLVSLGNDMPSAGTLAKAVSFADEQKGKPYLWGGTGPDGWDCSGFMSAITQILKGGDPHKRLFSTASFASGRGPAGFVPGLGGLFNLGVVQARNGVAGHMAGTLNGRNVESRGGDGVVIGSSARGADHSLFTDRFRLAGYDAGGYLPPGVTMAVNNTGRPEPILTDGQWQAISRAAAGGDGAAAAHNPLVAIGEFHATPEQSPYAIAEDLAWVTRRRG